MMSKHRKVSKEHCFEKITKAQLVNMKTVMEPVRNSEYSKSDNFKKLSGLAQIPCFL